MYIVNNNESGLILLLFWTGGHQQRLEIAVRFSPHSAGSGLGFSALSLNCLTQATQAKLMKNPYLFKLNECVHLEFCVALQCLCTALKSITQ